MVYAAFGEYLAAPIGFRTMEGGGLFFIDLIHGDRCGDDISDPFLKPPVYQLELAHHPFQYSPGSCMALAALLGIALRVRIINMVSRHDRRIALGPCAR